MTDWHGFHVLIRKTGPSVNARSAKLLALRGLFSVQALAKETSKHFTRGPAEIGVLLKRD